MHRRVRFALIAAVTSAARIAAAQAPSSSPPRSVGSLDDDYRRLLQLTGAAPLASRMIRPLPAAVADSGSAAEPWADPWRRTTASAADSAGALRFEGVRVRTVYNSAVPFGMNDGALWAGKGVSTALDVSGSLHAGVLTVRLAPTFALSQNGAFALAPLVDPPANPSPYADHWLSKHIDRPQRFGDSRYALFDPGQSQIRVDWRGAVVAAGTENMWWGPGIDNSILMTDNAAGFPHALVGTGRPADIGIGKVEAMYVVGRLYDSGFWRVGPQADRNRRWLTGLVATFEPRGAPGLYLGGGRLFYEYIPAQGLGAADFLDVLQPFQKAKLTSSSNPLGNDQRDQMLALFARWVFPEVGFELYGEWGRNDHSQNTRDFILEPDHATGTVLGLQKVFRQDGGFLLLRAEATSLAQGRTVELRATPSWYAHHIVQQGYTERGQVVGAGIGPGSDMQSAVAEWYRRWGSLGVEVERYRDNSDSFYDSLLFKPYVPGNQIRHDVWTNVGLRGSGSIGPAEVRMRLLYGVDRNRYTVLGNDVTNWHLELSVAWRP